MSDEAAVEPAVPAVSAAPEGTAGARPEQPAEPELPPAPTGDPRVDAAVARLGELAGRPVPAHVEVFEDVHRRLQEILAAAGAEEAVPPPRPALPDALRPRP